MGSLHHGSHSPLTPWLGNSSRRRAPSPGSVEWNRERWNDPKVWELDGDNWSFHAQASGQPYDAWKRSVVQRLLEPYLGPAVDVVEIGCGHGRWSEHMVGRCRSLMLVDLSEKCVDVCRGRFHHPSVTAVANDGRSLPTPDDSADLVWSFGTFVHLAEEDIGAYLAECRRVLRPGGRFVLHHAGWRDWSLRFVPVTCHAGKVGRVVQYRLAYGHFSRGGGRIPMSVKRFTTIAHGQGLHVAEEVRRWGSEDEFGLAFRDAISVGTPAA